MSQRKPQIYESKNTILSRSSEPIKRFQNKMNVLNQTSRFPTIRLIKQTESSLMKENQAFYKFKYILQDNSDETNTVFFDANSRKFRTRSVKPQHPNKFKDSYNKISSFKSGQKYMKTKDYTSPNRNKQENLKNKGYNNEKGGMKKENVSNKINSLKINEKNINKSQKKGETINQINKENDDFIGKSNTLQSQNSSYNKNNNLSNTLENIAKNIPKDLSNSNQAENDFQNPDFTLPINSVDMNQQIPSNENQELYLNKDLYSNQPESTLKSLNENNNLRANKNMNFSEQANQNPIIETSQRIEERTLILVPGQTIEKKSVIENFDNPTEELIENPDGTISSILKQTKVTTITETTPIEVNRVQSIEGAPELPMYKQKMTHIYKTVTSINQKYSQKSPNKNKDINTNLNIDEIPENTTQILNKEKTLGDSEEIKGNLEEKINSGFEEGKKKHFDPNILPKGFKNEQELEKFLDSMNQKGDNISPQEKEKRFNVIKDIFNNIAKGKCSEDNIEKFAQLLANMSEKDRKEILEKLGKDPKNKNLLNKLKNLIEKQVEKQDAKNNEYGYNEGLSSSKKFGSGMKSLGPENVEVKDISPLKFNGLFLEISKYGNEAREKNPFEGPSPYMKFYQERKDKIKKQINNLESDDADVNEKIDIIKEGKI